MESLDGQQLFQSRLCQQLSLLTAVSESLTERIMHVETRLQWLEVAFTTPPGLGSGDWEGAAELLSGTEERLSRLERLLDTDPTVAPPSDSVIDQLGIETDDSGDDPFPVDEQQEFLEDEPQLFPEEQQGLLAH